MNKLIIKLIILVILAFGLIFIFRENIDLYSLEPEQNRIENLNVNDGIYLINNSNSNLVLTLNTNISSSLRIERPFIWIANFSPDYRNITINGEVCKKVLCDKSIPYYLSICYYCEE